MRYLKIFFLVGLLLLAGNAWGQKVSGENEYFRFTIEFKDTIFTSIYKDSLNLIKERTEISFLLMFAELMAPTKYRNDADIGAFMPTYVKIKQCEKILADTSIDESKDKRMIQSRDAMAKIYEKLYAQCQYDWIDPKWRPKK